MEEEAILAPASLVALVEAPDRRQKSGILKLYEKMKFSCYGIKYKLEDLQRRKCLDENVAVEEKRKFIEDKLDFLRGKRILTDKRAEEGETYDLDGETKAILCMHLWSLMRRAGFSDPDKIWKAICQGWGEYVTWEKKYYGHFWGIIYSDKEPLRVQAGKNDLLTILDAYKDMERHFKGNTEYLLVNWPSAYDPNEDNPNPTFILWKGILKELTDEELDFLKTSLSKHDDQQSLYVFKRFKI